jgi:hypothetical protein
MQHTSRQAFAVRARQRRTALQHCSASDYLIRPTGQSLGWAGGRPPGLRSEDCGSECAKPRQQKAPTASAVATATSP